MPGTLSYAPSLKTLDLSALTLIHHCLCCVNQIWWCLFLYTLMTSSSGSNSHQIQQIIDLFSKRFLLKNLWELIYFLGIKVTRTPSSLLFNQRKYINGLLDRVNMTNTKPVATPMQTDRRMQLTSGSPLADASEYRTVVVCSIFTLRGQTLCSLSTNCLNSCMLPQTFIG